MQIYRECFLLMSVFAFAQFVQGDFSAPSQLMDLYGRGGNLQSIQWNVFRDFENDWKKTRLNPRIKPATASKLDAFFNKMDVAKDNYHRAMDEMVDKCRSAAKILPRLQAKPDASVASREAARFNQAFSASKAHLDNLKYALQSAGEFLSMVDPAEELSGDKKLIITDFQNGTVTLSADGEAYPPETLQLLLHTLSTYSPNQRNPLVTLYNFHPAGPAMSASRGLSQKGPQPSAFFARMETVRNQVSNIQRKVSAAADTIAEKVDNFSETGGIPSADEIEVLRRKCELYHP